MKKLFSLIAIVSTATALAHTEKLEVIEVTHGKSEESTLSSFIPAVSVMKEKELLKRRELTLGDTLKNEVGIQTSNFGPTSSRPIIRGLDGTRIRILQNGLGSLDASTQSLDHAIPIDTLTIDKVEIVRGPMSLLYGSNAVGGVVNIVNNRIHHEYSEGAVTQFDTRGETVTNSLSLSNRIDYGVNNWMFHFDGSVQNMTDLEIPGKARSARLRSRQPVSPEPKDEIPNSASHQTSLAVGASRVFDRGYAGFSYYRFDNDYGSVADEDVDIRMTQNRVEFASDYHPDEGTLKAVKLRSAQSFYKHEEIELDAIGTTFRNGGNETRLEFHTSRGHLTGITGLQTQVSTLRARGDEAFLPTSETENVALFTLQKLALTERDFLEAGARVENSVVRKRSSSTFGSSDEHGFVGLNGSLGYQHMLKKDHSLNGSFSYTERAPNFQELYANGPHIATGIFELGELKLRKEKVHALEFSFKKDSADSFFTFATYAQWFNDYINLRPTDTLDVASGFYVNEYRQENAIIYGAELDSRQELSHDWLGGSWWGITKADFTRGKGQGGQNLARMPAPRLTLGMEYERDRWNFDVEVQHYFDQTKVAEDELKTDAFTMVNLGFMYEVPRSAQNYRLYFRIKNLTDEEGRLATSFVKDIAPLPGRNFVAGVQALF